MPDKKIATPPDFVATFGVKYNHEPHSVLGKITPNGYLGVRGVKDPATARALIFALIGPEFAFMYRWTDKDFKPHLHYPEGEIVTIDVTVPDPEYLKR